MAIEPKTETQANRDAVLDSGKGRGNPGGTRFAVITLAVLLVLVGIYFIAVHGATSSSDTSSGAAQSETNGSYPSSHQ